MYYPILYTPDRNSLTETFYYNTTVFTGLSGVEYRKDLLPFWKFKSKFSFTAFKQHQIQELKNLLYSIKEEVMVPVYTFGQQTNYAEISTDTIYFPDYSPIKTGDKIIVSDHLIDGDLHGYFTVVDRDYSQKMIKIDKTVTLKIGTFVSWYKIGKLSTSLSSTNTVGVSEKFNLSFEEY